MARRSSPRGALARLLLVGGALGAVSGSACTRPKTVGRDRLMSRLRTATSHARETELLIQQAHRGRLTKRFTHEHAASLLSAVERLQKQLAGMQPEPGSEDLWHACADQLTAVHEAVAQIVATTK